MWNVKIVQNVRGLKELRIKWFGNRLFVMVYYRE